MRRSAARVGVGQLEVGVDVHVVPACDGLPVTRCWFARELDLPAGSCDGELVKAHLLPKEKIRRELASRRMTPEQRSAAVWDPRVWRPACGGPMGNGGHHGQFDSWALSVPREKVPAELVQWAEEHGLAWMIDWRFGT